MNFFSVINWRAISVFGKNKIINRSFIYLILVPMLAKLFSKIESPIEFSLGGEVMHLMLALPFSWKLFFFSALAFTIGAFLYNFFAPSIIRENRSFGEFLLERKNFSHIYTYREELGISKEVLEKWGINIQLLVTVASTEKFEGTELGCSYYKSNWQNKIGTNKIKVYQLTEQYLKNPNHTKEENLERSFWLLFNHANVSRKIPLMLTSLFYLVGFVMIGIVFIQSILEVIKWI